MSEQPPTHPGGYGSYGGPPEPPQHPEQHTQPLPNQQQGGYPEPQGGYAAHTEPLPEGGYYGPPETVSFGATPHQPAPGGPGGPGGPGDVYGPVGYGPPPPPRRRGLAVGATAVVTALAISGGAYAVIASNSGDPSAGSPAEPSPAAELIPDDAVAAASLNLDPGSDQTVATLKFLRKFGEIDGDTLSDAIFSSAESGTGIDPEDIKPWLGDNIAASMLIRDGLQTPVVAIQITDAEMAKDTLDEYESRAEGTDDEFGYVIEGDYAVLSLTEDTAKDAVEDAKQGNLANDDEYKHDIATLPGDSIGTAWADVKSMATLAKQGGAGDLEGVAKRLPARVAVSVRFEEDYFDLRAKAIGWSGIGGGQLGKDVANLPDDTVGAVGASGVDTAIGWLNTALERYEDQPGAGLVLSMIDRLEDGADISFPEDIQALVGSRTLVAIGGNPDEKTAIITSGSDPDRAAEVAEKLGGTPDTIRKTADGTILATSEEYADEIEQGGNLGGQDRFVKAVPDAEAASIVSYFDFERMHELDPDRFDEGEFGPMKAFGLSVVNEGDTTTAYLRVVAD